MWRASAAGGAEAGVAAGGFGEGVGFFEGGLDALDEAELGDAVAGGDEVGVAGEVGEDDFELAAVAWIDDAGEGGDAAEGETAAIFDQGSVGGGEFEGEAGADGLGGTGLADGGEGEGFGGEEIGGEIAEGADVGVTRKLRGGEQALDFDDGAGGSVDGHEDSDSLGMWGRRCRCAVCRAWISFGGRVEGCSTAVVS